MKLVLPVIMKPVSRKEDRSANLRFETRELDLEEVVELMKLEGLEVYICISEHDNFKN